MPSDPARPLPVYKRILLKLSGEALMGDQQFGVDPVTASRIAGDVGDIQQLGVQTAIVIGGGNIFRGLAASARGMDRATGDYMGMLATVINALALQDALEQQLEVMDATAISLCMDNRLPILVFDLRTAGNLRRAVLGEPVGSTVTA